MTRRTISFVLWLGGAPFALAAGACSGCGRGGAARSADPDQAASNVLAQSWSAYVARFIQADGRVIDYQADQVTTSEGQAYAMLRAAWMGDRATFERTHAWARNNLGVRADKLWAWKWGRADDGTWRVLDSAFAADADQDAALALLLAWKTWDAPQYLDEAHALLADLWQAGTLVAGGRRYLLAGDTLCRAGRCRINPSYYAPYAYRIFARHDPGHSWSVLVDTTYDVLEANAKMTATRLPSDWLRLDSRNGMLEASTDEDAVYSYDAFRVHWRIALDAALNDEPRAHSYLDRSLAWSVERWRREQKLPAVITPGGEGAVGYESLEMLSALMAALEPRSADVAESMRQRVQAAYASGIWGSQDAYYLQNWAWFGNALYARQLAPFALLR